MVKKNQTCGENLPRPGSWETTQQCFFSVHLCVRIFDGVQWKPHVMRCLIFVVIMPPCYKSRQRPPSPSISIAFSSGCEAFPIVHRPVLASTATGTARCHSRTRTCMSCALLMVIYQHSPLQIVIIPHRPGVVCDIRGYSLAAASVICSLGAMSFVRVSGLHATT